MRGRMAVNVRKLFKANCGPGVSYIGVRFREREQYRTVVVAFKRGERTFELDGVIHDGNSPDERLANAVLRIAAIAKGLEQTLAQPDGAGRLKTDRILS